MTSLNRKLIRDLWGMKEQALAIALVIVSGVATFVMSLSVMDSLKTTQETFYRDFRFSDVFASMKRSPEILKERIREIPGVEQVETRVIADVKLEVQDYTDPVTGKIVSIPDDGEPMMNVLYIRQGRYIAPGHDDEVIISEAFAEAQGLEPGDQIDAIINGRQRSLDIVGIALSPEYIYQLKPGAIVPDFERYGVLWMGRDPLSAAYDMEGGFNDLVLKLSGRANAEAVIERVDTILEPYGGLGAYERKDQISHQYLTEEFRSLGQMATIFPVIFLSVAAFLLNVVVTRLVSTQREQVAALKAFGYRNLDVGYHYLKLVMLIVAIGVVAGIGVGVWLGKGLGNLYMEYYRFPFLLYKLRPNVIVYSVLVSVVAAALGTVYAIWKASSVPPAQAMRPEPPQSYREAVIERIGFKTVLSQPTRMIARHIERKPLKALLTIIGISLACSILMVGSFFEDAVDYMVGVQFGLAQREDLTVTFVEPTSRKALFELQGLPGVEYVEPFRVVPARIRFQHRSYRTSVIGVSPKGILFRLLDDKLNRIEIPSTGIVLTDYLGEILNVHPGDILTIEVLEGSRPTFEVPVTALVNQYIGLTGYMELSALNGLMQEGNAISGVYLASDSVFQEEIFDRLHEMPWVVGTEVRKNAIKSFYETMSDQVLIFAFISTILASTIAFGVVYNSARIALSERSRELASLRVLGFTRGEISYILLGELALLTLAAIPMGFVIGNGLCAYMVTRLDNELFRIPLILDPSTYAFSAAVVLVSATISALIVRHRLDYLDLIAVLKTKE